MINHFYCIGFFHSGKNPDDGFHTQTSKIGYFLSGIRNQIFFTFVTVFMGIQKRHEYEIPAFG